ncbi:hypothetical protein OO013_01880 [Mangrovivirga sp. M17]|uniref:Uncharacterized protein n=1 Tax=Mangrovivirga halotolerans TaxID=2993936 RepID=A0ABT3RL96_9BACT|nr:hypothetical protein [Mangrovivirga halotolerans]MCX2742592.1 hypothetical protein [Mangrovivirga halotolerans]
MNKIFFIFLILFTFGISQQLKAQYPKTSRLPVYTAIDSATYHAGMLITFGKASASHYRYCFIPKPERISKPEVYIRRGIEDLALPIRRLYKDEEDNNVYVVIRYFLDIDGGSSTKVRDLVIHLDRALEAGEVKSQNENFNPSDTGDMKPRFNRESDSQ